METERWNGLIYSPSRVLLFCLYIFIWDHMIRYWHFFKGYVILYCWTNLGYSKKIKWTRWWFYTTSRYENFTLLTSLKAACSQFSLILLTTRRRVLLAVQWSFHLFHSHKTCLRVAASFYQWYFPFRLWVRTFNLV